MFQGRKTVITLIWPLVQIVIIIMSESKTTFGESAVIKSSYNWRNPYQAGDLILGVVASIDKNFDPIINIIYIFQN